MARPLRLELAGGVYHVTTRGDRREDIFLNEEDRERWLEILGSVCQRYNWRCHAYCQMTNHYHVVVETPEANLAKGMRQLNGVYTQTVNRHHDRVGHVFQGRYKAILVEKDAYLLELVRYVVLNPVRAGMVAEAAEWPWSSHRAVLLQRSAESWLDRDWILGHFGKQRRVAARKYADFVRAGAGLPSIWDALQGPIALGGESFVKQLRQAHSSERDLREVPRSQRRTISKSLAEYRSLSDGPAGMAQAYLSGNYTLQEIADHFGVHYSTVSRAVKAFEDRAKGNIQNKT
jgi:REP-associated tyrosine transposase